MAATRLFMRLRGKTLDDAAATRRRLFHRAYPRPAGLRTHLAVSEQPIAGFRVVTLTPPDPRPGRILYTPGGCYTEAPVWAHWRLVEALAEATGLQVSVAEYPLAPEHTHREVYAWLDAVHATLTGPGPLFLAGDSAGGGLALGQAIVRRDAGLPAATGLILIAPWLDLTLADPAIAAMEGTDPMLAVPGLRVAGEAYAGGDDPLLPHLSPLHAELSGLPPMLVLQGTADLLLPDVRTLKARADAVGAPVELHEYPGAIHVFPGATFTPEARDAYAKIAAFTASLA